MPGWLQQQEYISYNSGGWEIKGHGATDSVPGEYPLPDLQMAIFSVYPHMG